MANLKEAMKRAKETGKPQKVTEPTAIESVKVNISIRLDLEVLNWVKAEAERRGLPYQTYINSILTMTKNMGSFEDRMARVELNQERIEKKVSKGKAG